MDVQHELAVVRGKHQVLRAPFGAGEAPSVERGERRVVRLQRGDVSRAGLRDRKGSDRPVELAP
jgi:hypothetical protein